MAKQKVTKKKAAKINGAQATKKFFTITALVVVVLLVLIYLIGNR